MLEDHTWIMLRFICKRSKSICCRSLYRPQLYFQDCQLPEEKQFYLLLVGQTISHRKFHLFPQNHTGESDWAKTEPNTFWSEQTNQSQKYLILTLVIKESLPRFSDLWASKTWSSENGLISVSWLALFWWHDRHYSSKSGLRYHIQSKSHLILHKITSHLS